MSHPHLGQYPSVICAWCDKTISTETQRPQLVSHGICPECDATLLKEPYWPAPNLCSHCMKTLPAGALDFCSDICRRLAAQEMAHDLANEVDTPPTDKEMDNDARSPY